jgi:predicted nucleotidyltransferase component of viral defense system
MTIEKIEELDLPAWVRAAPSDKKDFREAVHIVLNAISTSAALRSKMVMKGGMLMAIRYGSSRFTKDADFSTVDMYKSGDEKAILAELDKQLDASNDALAYDTICLRQTAEIRPKRDDAKFPTLSLSIGYAPQSKAKEMQKLRALQSAKVVKIDYSYNEAVFDVEVIALTDGEELQAYSFLNLMAEKLRSLLQQPTRKRKRRQDVYDLNLLITECDGLNQEERQHLLGLIVDSCAARDIVATKTSIANPDVKAMAAKGYEDLEAEVAETLLDFEHAYTAVQDFYEALPWPADGPGIPAATQ